MESTRPPSCPQDARLLALIDDALMLDLIGRLPHEVSESLRERWQHLRQVLVFASKPETGGLFNTDS